MKRNNILFLDIDNTLIFPNKEKDSVKIIGEDRYISKKTIDLIKKLQRDYFIVLATGRRFSSYERFEPYIRADYAILEHGSLIYNKTLLDKEWAQTLQPIIGTIGNKKGLMWDYEVSLKKSVNTTSHGRHGSFRIDPKDNNSTQSELEKKITKIPKDLTYVRNEKFIDIIPKKATKIHAMTFLANKLNINWANTFFVGDDYNDMDALKKISHPFTYADATPKVVDLVKKRHGYVSSKTSFSAINDILLYIQNYHNQK